MMEDTAAGVVYEQHAFGKFPLCTDGDPACWPEQPPRHVHDPHPALSRRARRPHRRLRADQRSCAWTFCSPGSAPTSASRSPRRCSPQRTAPQHPAAGHHRACAAREGPHPRAEHGQHRTRACRRHADARLQPV